MDVVFDGGFKMLFKNLEEKVLTIRVRWPNLHLWQLSRSVADVQRLKNVVLHVNN